MSSSERKFHPASELFPLFDPVSAEFRRLAESIQREGLHNPIWLHPDGSILDGRNRYRASVAVGVEPVFQTWQGTGDPVMFVLAQNACRRQLDATGRALLAFRLVPHFNELALQRSLANLKRGTASPEGGNFPSLGKTAGLAARLAGSNEKYVQQLIRLYHEDPDLFGRVETQSISLTRAWEEFQRGKKQKPFKQSTAAPIARQDIPPLAAPTTQPSSERSEDGLPPPATPQIPAEKAEIAETVVPKTPKVDPPSLTEPVMSRGDLVDYVKWMAAEISRRRIKNDELKYREGKVLCYEKGTYCFQPWTQRTDGELLDWIQAELEAIASM
jgi:hypothetical protein